MKRSINNDNKTMQRHLCRQQEILSLAIQQLGTEKHADETSQFQSAVPLIYIDAEATHAGSYSIFVRALDRKALEHYTLHNSDPNTRYVLHEAKDDRTPQRCFVTMIQGLKMGTLGFMRCPRVRGRGRTQSPRDPSVGHHQVNRSKLLFCLSGQFCHLPMAKQTIGQIITPHRDPHTPHVHTHLRMPCMLCRP